MHRDETAAAGKKGYFSRRKISMSEASAIRTVGEITTASDWIITLNVRKMIINHKLDTGTEG